MGLVDDEAGQALLAGPGIGHCEEHQAAGVGGVADELLGAVDDVPVTLFHRSGLEVRRIGPRLRFGQAERPYMFAGRQFAQPAVLLGGVAVVVYHDAGRRIMHRDHGGDGTIAGRDLLQQHGIGDGVDLTAVPFRRRGGAEHAQLTEFGDDLGFDALLLLALRRQGRQSFLGEAADHVDDQGVAGRGDVVGHGDCLRLRTLRAVYTRPRPLSAWSLAALPRRVRLAGCSPTPPLPRKSFAPPAVPSRGRGER
jgi:hypothetical protein